jgi:hypothetical protein
MSRAWLPFPNLNPEPMHVTTVLAVQHVRRMRGGSQSHMIRCSDGNFYVVKFRNNPQHLRILANEMLATRLAEYVGLPVPATVIVEVGAWLVEHTPAMNIQLPGSTVPCKEGPQFGSLYAVSPLVGQVFDRLPMEVLSRVQNLETFAGILAMDKWTCNSDLRQAAFWRTLRQRTYRTTFIDQGHCFNAGEWNFPDRALRGVYSGNEVYERVTGWESFQPWLSRIEHMEQSVVWGIAASIPPEWYASDWSALQRLVERLLERLAVDVIRRSIGAFQLSPRHPFPNWIECALEATG